MAITQTGSTLTFPIASNANTGTVSSTITVPADAELVYISVTGFQGTASGLEAMTFTKGGVDTTMSKATGGDASASFMQSAVFTLVLPDTGTNKSAKWDWIGTGTSSASAFLFSVSFFKGVDTASPVRDSDGAQASGVPFTTPTLTCVSGDLIVAYAGADTSAEGTVDTWSNLTLLTQLTRSAGGPDGALATGSPSGNTTVAASTATNWADGGIVAVVLKAAGGLTVVDISQTANPAGASASSNVATYSSQSIGAADATRIVVLLVGTELASSVATAATIDIGGGALAMTAGSSQTLGAVTAMTFYRLVPTGTSAEFKVTFGATNPTDQQNHVAVYRVVNSETATIVANGATDTDADPISVGPVTVPATGGMLAICSDATDTTARTWTGLTEDIDADAGAFRFSTGFINGGGDITTTVSGGNAEDAAFSYLVFTVASSVTFTDWSSSSMIMPGKHHVREMVGY